MVSYFSLFKDAASIGQLTVSCVSLYNFSCSFINTRYNCLAFQYVVSMWIQSLKIEHSGKYCVLEEVGSK
jgi:hypothetical protein